MNKKLMIAGTLMLIFSFNIVVGSSVNIDNNVRLTLLRTEPDPATPGNYVDLYLQLEVLENDARGSKLENLKIELIPEFPLKTYPGEEKVISFGTLLEGQTASFKHRLLVEPDAIGELARIRAKYTATGLSSDESAPLEINIQRIDPRLEISGTKLVPEKINQGKVSKMSLILNNPTNGLMKDITIDLGLPDELTPIGGTATKKIKQLSAGETVPVEFNLMAGSDADSDAYKIAVEITFSDSVGNSYSRNETLGVLIDSEPEFQIDIEEREVYTKNSKGDVVVSISNTGPSDLRFLTMEILDSKDYKVLSNPRIYVGDLSPDDFETVQYEVYLTADQDTNLKVRIEYKDAFNEQQQEILDVPMEVYDKREAQRMGVIKDDVGPIDILIYIIIFLFLIQVYKNWRREKDLWKGFKVSIKKDVKFILRPINRILRGRNSR